jgi:hypothetical protein
MEERRLKPGRKRDPQDAADLVAAMTASGRRGAARRIPHAVLAALTRTIEGLAETGGPVVEATADAIRGDDPGRQQERLLVALRNFEPAPRSRRSRGRSDAAEDGTSRTTTGRRASQDARLLLDSRDTPPCPES